MLSSCSPPFFQQLQSQLTNFIRDPEHKPAPVGHEARRLAIYCELFFNNIEGFISNGFPVLRSLVNDDDWRALVRDFMRHYHCSTPYFLEIGQEFLAYLQQGQQTTVNLPFLLELAHYEWVELALDIAEQDLEQWMEEQSVNRSGDLLEGRPALSPLAWSLAYQFPVQQIGPSFEPQQAGQRPTFLVVYRMLDDRVRFMEANTVTARLLELLGQDDDTSGRQLLLQIANEMQHPLPTSLLTAGAELLTRLQHEDIILGSY